MSQGRLTISLMGAFLILGGLAPVAPSESARAGSEARDKCCFENSRYAGVCVVQPGEEETCASILEYLNNPVSSGKSYCGFTDIRGGWKEVSCEEESGSPLASIPAPIPVKVGADSVQAIQSDQNTKEANAECGN